MKIYNFSRILGMPFGIVFVLILVQSFRDESISNRSYYWLIPLLVILSIIYVFQYQINEWWLKKYPIPLDDQDRQLLEKHSVFFKGLNETDKIRFGTRVYQFVRTKEFVAIGKEHKAVPYDIQLLTAMVALEVSFFGEKPLYDNYDRIIFYKHPFPTPKIQQLHTVETHAEDGVILMALDYLAAAITDPVRFYHIGYHAFGEAFMFEQPKLQYPEPLPWSTIEHISKFTAGGIKKTIGLPRFDMLPIGISMYFAFGDRMKELYPELHTQFDLVFRTTRYLD